MNPYLENVRKVKPYRMKSMIQMLLDLSVITDGLTERRVTMYERMIKNCPVEDFLVLISRVDFVFWIIQRKNAKT